MLWLATAIVHHANRVRENRSGVKVGGHQASSASMVSLMTALWFSELRAEDRVSVKPHASPVLHAINYLFGRLERPALETLRAFGGLQSYPSRTKDPDPVDYSTGSVGIGATAPIWSAFARRYLDTHRFEAPPMGRQLALVGDAELDEGAIWEAIADPSVAKLGEVVWVVDLNRQSLDRVVPDIAFGRWAQMFEAAGWQTINVKYGTRLDELFQRPGGAELRKRIDSMPNEEYQRLLRSRAGGAARAAPGARPQARQARRRARRRRAARRCARPRRARPGQADRGLPADRPRPPHGRVRVHDQGLVAPDRGPPREPLGAADARPDGGAGRRAGRGRRRSLGGVRPEQPGGRAVRRGGGRARARRAAAGRSPGRAAGARALAQGPGVDPAGLRSFLLRPRPGGARGGRAGGDGQPRRGQLHQPRRLARQGRRLVGGRPARLVRRRSADARALARVDGRQALRAGHRRDQPGRSARRAGRHLEPLRPAAAANRDDLRPVRRPRARAVVLRHVRGRAVDPRRHAQRRVAGARGRRPSVDRHALDRDRPAGLHRLGAGVRAGPRVDAAARARAARPA